MRGLIIFVYVVVMLGLIVFLSHGILTLLGDMDQSTRAKQEVAKEQVRIADSLAAVATKEFNEEILLP